MTIRNPLAYGSRGSAATILVTGFLFSATAACADSVRTAGSELRRPVTPADAGAAGRGLIRMVPPVLSHTNSGAMGERLTVDGLNFTPDRGVEFELLPMNPGDFNPISKYRFASDSGAAQVTFGYQTVPARSGGKSGFVVAQDSTTLQTTPPLPVTVLPPGSKGNTIDD
jgi:hypothetical protein